MLTHQSHNEGRAKVVAALEEKRVNYLIHCAAIIEPLVHLKDLKLESFRSLISTNLEAPLFLTQQLTPLLAESARVMFISSGAAHKPAIGVASYGISKAALSMLYSSYKEEYQGQAIHFGSLRPGLVESHMQRITRETSPSIVPMSAIFKQREREPAIFTPERSALFISWVLLCTEASTFSEQEWNIEDKEHHNQWLTPGETLYDIDHRNT